MYKNNNIAKNVLCSITVLLFFCTQISIGQTYTEVENENQETQKISSATNLFSLLGVNNQSNTINSSIVGNSVFVKQIGSLNQVKIGTATQASDIKLSQNGSFNTTNLNYTANTAFADLVQNGNNNTIIDFVNDPQENASLELTQTGDGKYFERDGVNSMTRSLKLIQTEASPTIIIRSFN